MKIVLAICYFFGSIFFLFALGLLGLFLAPPPYALDRTLISGGTFTIPEKVFPDLQDRKPFGFPGTQAGLSAGDAHITARVLVPSDPKGGKALMESYARSQLSGNITMSKGPGYVNYTKRDQGRVGRMRLVDGVVLHVEGKEDSAVERVLTRSGLLTPNPEANLLTDIFRTDTYFMQVVVVILLYMLFQVPLWARVGSWAATAHPEPGTLPVAETELRGRLLAINGADCPLQVVEGRGGKLEVIWRLADAKWVGLLTANHVRRTQIIRLLLSDEDKTCRGLDISKKLVSSADGAHMRYGFSLSFFRGISFFQKEYEKESGFMFRDGRLTFDTAYQYRFSLAEMKAPVLRAVLSSGWKYKPVVFFTRFLGG